MQASATHLRVADLSASGCCASAGLSGCCALELAGVALARVSGGGCRSTLVDDERTLARETGRTLGRTGDATTSIRDPRARLLSRAGTLPLALAPEETQWQCRTRARGPCASRATAGMPLPLAGMPASRCPPPWQALACLCGGEARALSGSYE